MAAAIRSSPLSLVLSSRRSRKRSNANLRVTPTRFASHRGEFSGSRVHYQGGICYRGAMPIIIVKARVNAFAQLPFPAMLAVVNVGQRNLLMKPFSFYVAYRNPAVSGVVELAGLRKCAQFLLAMILMVRLAGFQQTVHIRSQRQKYHSRPPFSKIQALCVLLPPKFLTSVPLKV